MVWLLSNKKEVVTNDYLFSFSTYAFTYKLGKYKLFIKQYQPIR